LLLFIGGACAWFRSWVETDDEELRHKSIFGTRTLKWNEINGAAFNGLRLEIKGNRSTIRVGPLADLAHLQEEITRKSGVEIKLAKDFKIGV